MLKVAMDLDEYPGVKTEGHYTHDKPLLQQWDIIEEIGKQYQRLGSPKATVYLCKDKNTNKFFVLKEFDQVLRNNWENESNILLNKLKSPICDSYLLCAYSSGIKDNKYYIATEYLNGYLPLKYAQFYVFEPQFDKYEDMRDVKKKQKEYNAVSKKIKELNTQDPNNEVSFNSLMEQQKNLQLEIAQETVVASQKQKKRKKKNDLQQVADLSSLVVNICYNLIRGITHLHNVVHIAHGDIDEWNIMYNNEGSIKYIDFGKSIYLDQDAAVAAGGGGGAATVNHDIKRVNLMISTLLWRVIHPDIGFIKDVQDNLLTPLTQFDNNDTRTRALKLITHIDKKQPAINWGFNKLQILNLLPNPQASASSASSAAAAAAPMAGGRGM